MITEIALGVSNLALIVAFGFYVKEHNQEKARLINAILSKDSQDYVQRTLAENTKIEPEINKKDPDLVPFEQLNDEQFDKHIQETLANEPGEVEL